MDPEAFLPLPAADLQLLMVLSASDQHAYGISRSLDAERTGVPLPIGSLYRMISRLQDDGLIERRPEPSGVEPDGRRRYYGITPLGRRILTAEVRRYRAVVQLAEDRGIVADTGS